MTLWEMYQKTNKILSQCLGGSSKSEVDIIFNYLFKMDRVQIILNKNRELKSEEEKKILEIIEKRKKRIPLQYIMKMWEFMGFEFIVGEGVLIPREDTSVLVKESADFLSKKTSPKIVDLCSGSGCIAIALEKILKNAPEIYGIEISKKAFSYFKKNIKKHKSKTIAINEDIFKAYKNFDDNSLDAVISNPPYIKTSDINDLQPEVKFEPIIALDGGEDGVSFYKEICKNWVSKLKNNGLLAFELGQNQFENVKKIMLDSNLKNIKIIKDINNIERVVTGVKC